MLKITMIKLLKIIVKLAYITMFFIGALTVASYVLGGDVLALAWAVFVTFFAVAVAGAFKE